MKKLSLLTSLMVMFAIIIIAAVSAQARNVAIKLSQSGTTLENYATYKPVAIRVTNARHSAATGTVSVTYGSGIAIGTVAMVGTSNITQAVSTTNYLVRGDVITPTQNWTNSASEVYIIMEE